MQTCHLQESLPLASFRKIVCKHMCWRAYTQNKARTVSPRWWASSIIAFSSSGVPQRLDACSIRIKRVF